MDDLIESIKRVWIPRETWRQEKAVVLARDAIAVPHAFIAHDRARATGSKDHLWQWKRGVMKALPDTQTIFGPKGQHCWFEFKAKGKTPDDDQLRMLQRFRDLGDFASWGVALEDLVNFWVECGVPLVTNAYYRAVVLDGLVDSRIAKAEGRTASAKPKRTARTKAVPRYTGGKGFVRRATAGGILV